MKSNVLLSNHARKRLQEKRQSGITIYDVLMAAEKFPCIAPPSGYRIKNCIAKSGKRFELPISDKNGKRIIITVVGLK